MNIVQSHTHLIAIVGRDTNRVKEDGNIKVILYLSSCSGEPLDRILLFSCLEIYISFFSSFPRDWRFHSSLSHRHRIRFSFIHDGLRSLSCSPSHTVSGLLCLIALELWLQMKAKICSFTYSKMKSVHLVGSLAENPPPWVGYLRRPEGLQDQHAQDFHHAAARVTSQPEVLWQTIVHTTLRL